MKTMFRMGSTEFQVAETEKELSSYLNWDKLSAPQHEIPDSTFLILEELGENQSRILEKVVVSALKRDLVTRGYTLIGSNGKAHRPDVSALLGDSCSTYKVKGPQAGRGDTRSAFAQALDGFIGGYTSYAVLPVHCLPYAQRLREYYPVGLITYKLEAEEIVFTAQWESETPSES